MNPREILRIALRYSFAFGKGHLSTFLSSLSTIGLVLAITLLITVLSVMNGFDKEMRERILSLVPHISVLSYESVEDWRSQAGRIVEHPDVVAVEPFVQFDALFLRGNDIETTRGLGLAVADRAAISEEKAAARTGLLAALPEDALARFREQDDGLVLGAGVAEQLEAAVGDTLTLIVPGPNDPGAASAARFERVTVSAILETGTELDQVTAVLHLARASELAGLDGAVSGLQVTTRDIFDVARVGWELLQNLPPGYYSSNWMQTHGNLYAAIQLSRDLVSILLFSIIAVAAFNVVSSLVLVVFDKQGDIAILRTLGASGANIAWVFVLQGALIGLVGVALGCALGVGLSLAVPDLVAGLERLLDYRFLNTDVYPVSFLPVDVLARDILMVGGVAFAMCVVAAIYPALRAARLAPALILHQEMS